MWLLSRYWKKVRAASVLVPLLFAVSVARAQVTDSKTQTITATVGSTASLTLGSDTVTFANADPATVSSIAATEGEITVTANARTTTSGTVTLTVLAGGDLVSGLDSIGIGNVTWAATGTGFQGGTLSRTVAQTVGTWTGSGTRSGTTTFSLANSFGYVTGTYTATLTYTLTAP